MCGNCGRQLAGHGFPTSLADHGAGRVKFALIAIVLVGLGALVWTQGRKAVDYLDGLAESSDSFDLEDLGGVGAGGGPGNGGTVTDSPYGSVRELVADLNKGGLDCTRVKVDHADDVIATGSCQAPGDGFRVHVQINIYFFRPSLESAEQIFSDRVFTYVHDANWFVITQPETAREVQKILGGRLTFEKN